MIPMTSQQLAAVRNKLLISKSGYATEQDALDAVTIVFFGDGAVDLPWCGMHLCIETNGHTHS